jgi:ABC-type sugar transport system ATPase subunit
MNDLYGRCGFPHRLYKEKGEDMQQYLVFKGIKKYFTGTKALDWDENDVMDVFPGEIHGLVGENGAGKSTLMQVLMGIHSRTAGKIYLDGKEFNPKNALEAEKNGVSIIMQQPNILPNLMVCENIFIGRDKEFFNNIGLIRWKNQMKEAEEILNKLGFNDIKPNQILSSLTFEQSKQVEIARALSINPKVLIVDETSAAVSMGSVEKLFSILKEQKEKGVAIIYISHFIDEIHRLCDRISILRDGKLVKSMPMKDATTDIIINNMVGREISKSSYRKDDTMDGIGATMFEAKNLNYKGKFIDVSIKVNKGEIVGIGGIGGAGSEELGQVLFGKKVAESGEILLNGKKTHINSPKQAMDHAIGYVPKDRDREGLIVKFNVRENISAANIKNIQKNSFINFKKEAENAEKAVKLLKIKTPSTLTSVNSLSGGNRQKVAIAKWVSNQSNVLIMNSPTRGVDVISKYEIYHIIENLKNEGKAILIISDELPELIGMCDRIYTMRKGRITGEFRRDENLGEELLIRQMT